jgi:hypothetical protein
MNEILKQIAESCVPNIIKKEEIINMQIYHASCKIQIHNNKIYTSVPVTEERNIQILRQLEEVTKYHELPNVIFVYNTMDQYSYPNWSDPIFTHAKIKGSSACYHILAPCFSFDYIYQGKEKLQYEKIYDNIREKTESYMKNIESWNKKQDKLTFIGSLYEDRKINTLFPVMSKVEALIIGNSMHNEKCIDITELCRYKYLLNLNGCGGGWSVRLKYLMMCGSLVFYIIHYNSIEKNNIQKIQFLKPYIERTTIHIKNIGINQLFEKPNNMKNYKVYNLYNIEYWMCSKEFEKHIVLVSDNNDCVQKLNYYTEHQDEAYTKSKLARDYVNEILSKENVMLYWKILLETYRSRFTENMDTLIYNVPFI